MVFPSVYATPFRPAGLGSRGQRSFIPQDGSGAVLLSADGIIGKKPVSCVGLLGEDNPVKTSVKMASHVNQLPPRSAAGADVADEDEAASDVTLEDIINKTDEARATATAMLEKAKSLAAKANILLETCNETLKTALASSSSPRRSSSQASRDDLSGYAPFPADNLPDEEEDNSFDELENMMSLESPDYLSPRSAKPAWSKRTTKLINRLEKEQKEALEELTLYSPNGERRGRHHPNDANYLSDPAEIEVDEHGHAIVPAIHSPNGYLMSAPVYSKSLDVFVAEMNMMGGGQVAVEEEFGRDPFDLSLRSNNSEEFGFPPAANHSASFDLDVNVDNFAPEDEPFQLLDKEEEHLQAVDAADPIGAIPLDDEVAAVQTSLPIRKRSAMPSDDEPDMKRGRASPTIKTSPRKRPASPADDEPQPKRTPPPARSPPALPSAADLRARLNRKIDGAIEYLQERLKDIEEICDTRKGNTSLLEVSRLLSRKFATFKRLRKEMPAQFDYQYEQKLDEAVAYVERISARIPMEAAIPAPYFRRHAGKYRR